MDKKEKKIIIPGANHEDELPEQKESVKFYNKNEKATFKEDRVIVERIYHVETVYSNGRKEIKPVKQVLTQHESGRQDVTVFTPRIGTSAKKK